MNLDFSSSNELFDLIKEINKKYYERLNANILYLEESYDKIFVVFITALRDAFAHLIRVFDLDITLLKDKQNAVHHLERYVSHLQTCLLDTFRKILSFEFKNLLNLARWKDKKIIEYEIAHEVYRLRIMGEGITVDTRIEGYITLLDKISDLRKKFLTDI